MKVHKKDLFFGYLKFKNKYNKYEKYNTTNTKNIKYNTKIENTIFNNFH